MLVQFKLASYFCKFSLNNNYKVKVIKKMWSTELPKEPVNCKHCFLPLIFWKGIATFEPGNFDSVYFKVNTEPPAFPWLLCLVTPHKSFFSEWYWLQISSALLFPSAAEACVHVACQGWRSGLVLIIQTTCFLSSFLVGFRDKGLMVSFLGTCKKVVLFFPGLFFLGGFISGPCTVGKISSFKM